MKQKVYSVTLEVKVVVRAPSRPDAVLVAMETKNIPERLESIKVVNVFCPAEGK
jgi:hypothetical protein